MAVKPISDRGRLIVLAMASAGRPMYIHDIAQMVARLGDISGDLGELVQGGTVAARGSMSEAQLKQELEHIWPYVIKAQQTGAEFRWKTQNAFAYELTKVGRDMVPLLQKMKGMEAAQLPNIAGSVTTTPPRRR
jgi:hypothetical protein